MINMASSELSNSTSPISRPCSSIESNVSDHPVISTPRIRQPCVSIKSSVQVRRMRTSLTRRSASIKSSVPTRPASTSLIRRPRASIESLPEEILLQVFSFLSPGDLCNVVSRVCKQWHALHRDPYLYHTLELKTTDGNTKAVIKLLRHAQMLKSLTIIDRPDMKEILEEVCKQNYQIRVLILKKLAGSYRINAATMKKVIQNCPELHTIKLHGCYVRGEVFYKNLSLKLPHLRTVHFVHGSKLSSGALLNLINNCMDIEDLRIYNNYDPLGDYIDIPNAGIISLCERFCKTIRILKLDFGVWSREAFAALKKCYQLETLGILEAHSMTTEGLLAVSSMASLRHLEITCCTVPEITWIRMFTATSLKNLLSLIVCRCNTTNNVAATIGTHLKNLQKLGMSGRLAHHPQAKGGVSAKGVASVITGCSKLSVLELLYMDITVEKAILLIPKFRPGLKKLFIFQENRLRWNSIDQVARKMPGLLIEYFVN